MEMMQGTVSFVISCQLDTEVASESCNRQYYHCKLDTILPLSPSFLRINTREDTDEYKGSFDGFDLESWYG
jgi:hypothetical protein